MIVGGHVGLQRFGNRHQANSTVVRLGLGSKLRNTLVKFFEMPQRWPILVYVLHKH